MADPPRYPDTDDDAGVKPEHRSTAGTPRWVSVVGIIVLITLVLLLVVLHLTGVLGPGAH